MNNCLLYPNFGAEEGRVSPPSSHPNPMHHLAQLWRGALNPGYGFLDNNYEPLQINGESIEEPVSAPSNAAIEGGLLPWLATSQTEELAAQRNLVHLGPSADVVHPLHDKAFCHDYIQRHYGEVPSPLNLGRVLELPTAATLGEIGLAIEAVLASWPDWARTEFTLKPRFGTSGRGRVPGHDGQVTDAMCRGVKNMATKGGALVEPWFDRTIDFSVQGWVDPETGPHCLGTTRQLLTPSGVYRGNMGELNANGEVLTGTDYDGILIETAQSLARTAAKTEFFGPFGVDAFTFRAPNAEEGLHPAIEFNARTTVGTIALGLLQQIATALPSNATRTWFFVFDAPRALVDEANQLFAGNAYVYHDSVNPSRSLMVLSHDRQLVHDFCQKQGLITPREN